MPHAKAPPVRIDPTERSPLPIQRRSLVALTLNAIRERILHGHYPEGEPLRQDSLAEELGVSRIPIREALRQLEAEGLVTFNPHRGAVVSTLSIDEIDEVFALRADIEVGLLRRAVPRLARDQLERAADVLTGYERALGDGDVAAWGEMNWQFHATLYAAAERPVTLAIVQRLHQQADRYLRMQLTLTHGESRASAEHRAILAATRRREARRAAQLLRAHILGAGSALNGFLRERRGLAPAIRSRRTEARA